MPDNPIRPGSTTVEITLEPDGDKTRFRLRHHGLPEDAVGDHTHGWTHYQDRLALAAEGGDPVAGHGLLTAAPSALAILRRWPTATPSTTGRGASRGSTPSSTASTRASRTTRVLRPLYPEDLGPGKRGLALFLGQYWGGPPTLTPSERGHPRLRARHLPFAIDTPERDAWVGHMTAAVRAGGLSPEDEAEFLAYVETAATHMINQHPLGLRPS